MVLNSYNYSYFKSSWTDIVWEFSKRLSASEFADGIAGVTIFNGSNNMQKGYVDKFKNVVRKKDSPHASWNKVGGV